MKKDHAIKSILFILLNVLSKLRITKRTNTTKATTHMFFVLSLLQKKKKSQTK